MRKYGQQRSRDTLLARCSVCVCVCVHVYVCMCVRLSSFTVQLSVTTAQEKSVTQGPRLLGSSPSAICSTILQKTTKVSTDSFHPASSV